MKKRSFVLAMVAVTAAALAVGGLFASNMGFKLNYQLLAGSDPGSVSGTNTIALPYNAQTGITMASHLQTDIGFADVAQVQTFIESNDGVDFYTGRKGSPPDFALIDGSANYVKMNNNVNYIIVGSHNASLAIDLDAGTEPDSNSGTNFFAYPYHSTAATALDLMNDIGFASVAQVQRFVESNDGVEFFTGRKGSPPVFNLIPGEGYYLKMNSTASYVPSHY